MRRRHIAGTGWKMNKTAAEARQYTKALLSLLDTLTLETVEVFVLPPFTSLAAVKEVLGTSRVGYGGQNMHWDTSGAWTGEIAAPMLVEAGCRYVELGHSERRYYFNETDEYVNRKVRTALAHSLVPIVCIGETDEEKAAGQTESVLYQQVSIALSDVPAARVPDILLAYEPRWAIGKDDAASPDYVQDVHALIRAHLNKWYGADIAAQTRVIYGGSVNLDNSAAIIAQPDVDGLFIGRAALDAQKFVTMVKIVADAARMKE